MRSISDGLRGWFTSGMRASYLKPASCTLAASRARSDGVGSGGRTVVVLWSSARLWLSDVSPAPMSAGAGLPTSSCAVCGEVRLPTLSASSAAAGAPAPRATSVSALVDGARLCRLASVPLRSLGRDGELVELLSTSVVMGESVSRGCTSSETELQSRITPFDCHGGWAESHLDTASADVSLAFGDASCWRSIGASSRCTAACDTTSMLGLRTGASQAPGTGRGVGVSLLAAGV